MKFDHDLVLENELVLLRPVSEHDLPQLEAIALDEDIWRYMPTRIGNKQELTDWMNAALQDRKSRQRYVFVIIDKATGRLAGSTAFGNISDRDKRLEIGWTWLGRDFRGTGMNKQVKFLLFSYAFEVLQYERVEQKTDVLNLRSRSAMLKTGATEEGILRSHTLMQDGRRRDTIYYSILRPEWQRIRQERFGDLLTPENLQRRSTV
ncbi:GNAT family N-acetyltransferase [Pontibacter sp. JH31]|uniref:GNAT family N-acetyltransferase n=1 Tax=Pontibacter aquaedesilientis TaxID=2766980 RepID=A0ABR7XGD1_9BACT|nr:GNAT family protein [Pontibacter aquaedesilientis]MBD1396991.1 GNAT family N-acetyltransferase [Pontibacter aquaedesilientis]